jgi:hypothetical protein
MYSIFVSKIKEIKLHGIIYSLASDFVFDLLWQKTSRKTSRGGPADKTIMIYYVLTKIAFHAMTENSEKKS